MLEEMERPIWEAEHPEEAARERAEFEAWRAMGETLAAAQFPSPEVWARRQRIAELKATADRCVQCAKPFGAADVIYRRRKRSPLSITSEILPYCAEHRCSQREGQHNRDLAHPGYTYRGCRCEDHHWEAPQPCVGCARLVSNPRHAPWRYGRGWNYADEQARGGPRVFCGSVCRSRVRAVEAKVRRLGKAVSVARCADCTSGFIPRRHGAHYCSNACRQRAYRERKALRTVAGPDVVQMPAGM